MYALFFIFRKAIFRENVIEKGFVIDFAIEIINFFNEDKGFMNEA